MTRHRSVWFGLALLGTAASTAPAAVVGTAFTYQGRLTDNGSPAGGTHNFVFRLCTGSTCSAADVIATYPPAGTVAVPIANGLFTVPVDFGANVFTTDARWLEIVVDGTTLCPRQELTPAPFALALPGLWTQQNATSPNVIGGQSANSVTAGAVGATISGGGAGGASNNRATDNYATVGGGADNQAGNNNANVTDAFYATAAGGSGNNATSSYATVAGGRANTASQAYGAVGGGRSNNVSAQYGTIAGGGTSDPNLTSTANRVSDTYGTVAGGGNNRAGDGAGTSSDRPYASVGGGEDNQANGMHSTIPGGLSNRANGTGSFAAGRQAQALHDGSFVWSDGTGVMASTATNQFLIKAGSGVGIGVVPGAGEMLSVGGLVESTSGGFKFPDGTTQTTAAGSSLWTAAGSDIYNANAGSVGIGTSAPAMKLDVNGAVRSSGATGGAVWAVNPNNQLASVGLGWLNDVARIRIGGSGAGAANGFDIQASGDASLLRILNSGEVGVGTPTPGAKLDVVGTGAYAMRASNSSPSGYGVYAQHSATSGATPAVYGQTDSTASNAFAIHGKVNATSAGGSSAGVRGENLSTTGSGIGVWGSQAGGGYGVYGSAPSGWGVYGAASATTGANRGVYGESGGDAGYGGYFLNYSATGTTYGVYCENNSTNGYGLYALHDAATGTGPAIYGQTDSTSSNAFAIHGKVNATSAGGFSTGVRGENLSTSGSGIGVWGSQNGGGYGVYGTAVGGIGVIGFATGSGYGGYFYSASGTSLYVDGTASVNVLEVLGADVAERFPTSDPVEPGMVVEIDPDNAGTLRLSRQAYNRRVAGVVSGAGDLPAGAILGNLKGNEAAPPIALTGRVWVHCDAASGAIEPGDLLTTAATPGHAMKVLDHPRAQGAIIGKAMSKLAAGEQGLVLTLVNLQ